MNVPTGMTLVVETTPTVTYSTKGTEGPVVLTLTNVKQDVTVNLSVKEYSDATRTFSITNNDNNDYLNATTNTGIANGAFGVFTDGGYEWALTEVTAGYVPSITAYKANMPHTAANEVELSDKNLVIEYTGEDTDDTLTTWTITMSDIDQSLDLVFDAKPIVTGNREGDVVLDASTGKTVDAITVNVAGTPISCDETVVGAIGVTFDSVPKTVILDDAEEFSIYVFVMEGYKLAETGKAVEGTNNCAADPTAEKVDEVPSNITVPVGYELYKITVKAIAGGGTPLNTIDDDYV